MGLKSYAPPVDTDHMTNTSKSQAEVLWEQADNLIRESFQALTDLTKETK